MFQKHINSIIYWGLSVSLLAALTACTEGKTLEDFLGADPQLQKNQEQPETSPQISQENTSKPQKSENTNSKSQSTEQEINEDNSKDQSLKQEIAEDSDKSQPTEQEIAQELKSINVPENFPATIPLYPQAKLIEVERITTEDRGKTKWRSPDNIEQITSFYRQEFQDNQWEIIQAPISNSPDEDTLIALKDNLEVVLFSYQLSTEKDNNSANTEFTIEYQPNDNIVEPTAETVESETVESETVESASHGGAISANFSDLQETPEQLRQYVEDVANLGILTTYEQEGKVNLDKFAPNQPITRREYARWLVEINNRFYADSSGNKIHLATKSDEPAFKDISINDPDYAIIQGLAEAGLIPSRLTNDGSKLLFQPDAPLTREDLITWKVPLDLRKALPPASIETIADSWGFQDVNSIDAQGLRALFADFQNGEQANIRRTFGYTTLFQPKKTVTRAEAAASLWYLGFQGDGINAKEALKLRE